MNFERRGPSAFDENKFPLPGKDLASAHVGPEEVILVEMESKKINKEEKIPLYDGDEVETQDTVLRKEQQSKDRWNRELGYVKYSKRTNSMRAKNAKNKQRPDHKGSADLPSSIN